ncbi:MAG: peptidoglycan-associated lipoprotein Pal [Pseudomarimonas sp.]
MNNTTRLLLAAAICASMAACTKKKDVVTPPPAESNPPVATAPVSDGKFTENDLDTDSCLRQRVVYFDYDQADIRAEFAAQMSCHAKYLRDRPSARITLEGHADERGSREYNIGLGERRGNAVNGALTANGGSASQLSVVSYGEERPTCNDSADDCWGKNRRVEIVYTAR